MEELLLKNGWPPLQARALAELIGDEKPWGDDGKSSSWRATKLHDWASSHNSQDVTTLETQAGFVTHELRTVFNKLWSQMNLATDLEAVKKAAEPYFTKLREGKSNA